VNNTTNFVTKKNRKNSAKKYALTQQIQYKIKNPSQKSWAS